MSHIDRSFVLRCGFSHLLALTALTSGTGAQQCGLDRVSVSSSGVAANSESRRTALSGDGTQVAFGSNASNLVAGDSNSAADIFVRDRVASTTTRISLPTAGGQANGWSGIPSISSDGRFVAFRSIATNLDPLDADPKPDIYRHDRLSGETVLVSHRLVPGTHPEGAFQSSVSQDGRYVAFDCWDDNLVPGDVNHTIDVYVRDMQTGTMELISVGNQGELGDDVSDTPSISWDGRFVSFSSRAGNWFPGNVHKYPHVYVRDRVLGTTTLVSHAPSGSYGPVGGGYEASLSGDGTKVAFMYLGADIMPGLFSGHTWPGAQVFVRDLIDGSLTYVGYSIWGGLSDHECLYPKLSYDGRFVAWVSLSDNLTVTGGHFNENVYHRDLETGVTVMVCQGMGGAIPSGYSVDAAISGDGRTVAFASQASNLVPGDTGIVDIFVRECAVASPAVYCKAKLGASGCKPAMAFSGAPSASAGSGFLLCGDQLVANQPTLVLYSTRPAYAWAFGPGWLCLNAPLRRTPAMDSAGSGGCDGSIRFDMNAWIASGADPGLQAGVAAFAQTWCRDPADPWGAILSDAVAFLIAP